MSLPATVDPKYPPYNGYTDPTIHSLMQYRNIQRRQSWGGEIEGYLAARGRGLVVLDVLFGEGRW
jgi:hypothetical protein